MARIRSDRIHAIEANCALAVGTLVQLFELLLEISRARTQYVFLCSEFAVVRSYQQLDESAPEPESLN